MSNARRLRLRPPPPLDSKERFMFTLTLICILWQRDLVLVRCEYENANTLSRCLRSTCLTAGQSEFFFFFFTTTSPGINQEDFKSNLGRSDRQGTASDKSFRLLDAARGIFLAPAFANVHTHAPTFEAELTSRKYYTPKNTTPARRPSRI